MDELVKQISENMGVSQEEAHKAVQTMVDYLKEKLPPALYADVEAIMEIPEVSEKDARALGEYWIP